MHYTTSWKILMLLDSLIALKARYVFLLCMPLWFLTSQSAFFYFAIAWTIVGACYRAFQLGLSTKSKLALHAPLEQVQNILFTHHWRDPSVLSQTAYVELKLHVDFEKLGEPTLSFNIINGKPILLSHEEQSALIRAIVPQNTHHLHLWNPKYITISCPAPSAHERMSIYAQGAA